jgi:hypothetical protein
MRSRVKFEPPKDGRVAFDARDVRTSPGGRVALVGARVVTMAGADGGIIENGVVLVEGNRIALVGDQASATIPAGTPTVDVSGKTIIPGLIDAHAHGPYGVDEMTLQVNWSETVNLALGVTTRHDPSSRSALVFPALEMVRAGKIIGPRSFSTGEIVYGAKKPACLCADRQQGRCAGAYPPPEGAGCAQHQELQPAPPRSAPAGRCCRD